MVAALAFFDGVVLGAPVAVLAASFRPLIVYVVATTVAIVVVIASCRWVDRRWDDWLLGQRQPHGEETRSNAGEPIDEASGGLDRARLGPLVRVCGGSCNPILVLASARSISGKPVGDRRILLGSVAYAIPYVAMWSLVGLALGETIRSA